MEYPLLFGTLYCTDIYSIKQEVWTPATMIIIPALFEEKTGIYYDTLVHPSVCNVTPFLLDHLS